MKKGDKIPVFISGHEVANAEIVYVGDGKAEMIIPATKIVMGVRVELDSTPPVPQPTRETVVMGVDRAGPDVVESTSDVAVTPPVVPVEAPVNNDGAPVAQAITTTPEPTSTPAGEASTVDSNVPPPVTETPNANTASTD